MKAHIIDSSDPLKEGAVITAICGELVKEAVFVYMFDSMAAPELVTGMNTINTCRACYRTPLSKKYGYGLIARSELRPEPNQEEDIVAA